MITGRKCTTALDEGKTKKQQKQKHQKEIWDKIHITLDEEDDKITALGLKRST